MSVQAGGGDVVVAEKILRHAFYNAQGVIFPDELDEIF
uniref:Uncharacterized protein n=1 Tax=Aggregatibacter actinomycetemcomitans TaxID=714 RepID=S4WBU5_AGGAC|nr:hypothetical protein S23Aspa_0036 [Aggregatibacter actinomycetemcomitans]